MTCTSVDTFPHSRVTECYDAHPVTLIWIRKLCHNHAATVFVQHSLPAPLPLQISWNVLQVSSVTFTRVISTLQMHDSAIDAEVTNRYWEVY